MNISGAKVLLTGATGGIGHAIARRLRGQGATLVLTARRKEILEPLAAEVGGVAVAADLADDDDVERLVRDHGDVDILVANAALPASGHVHSFDDRALDRAIDINLRAPIVLASKLSEGMVQRRRGHIVMVSSLAGRTSTPGSAVYSATKFGLRGFAHGLRGDLLPAGVGVSTIFPGFIRDAGMFADSGAKLPWYVGTSSPEEVAAAVSDGITRNRPEITVAPLPMKLLTVVSELAPGPASAVARRMGSERLSRAVAEGQADKR